MRFVGVVDGTTLLTELCAGGDLLRLLEGNAELGWPLRLRLAGDACRALRLAGLMTIGAPGDMGAFDRPAACRERPESAGIAEPGALRLSMGMSGDFADAIAKGSDAVRVGSSIFGARDYSNLGK